MIDDVRILFADELDHLVTMPGMQHVHLLHPVSNLPWVDGTDVLHKSNAPFTFRSTDRTF